MKYFAVYILVSILSGIFLPAQFLYAAEIIFAPLDKTASVGQEIAIDLFLDTKGSAVNALSGKISLTGPVVISRIHDGDSIIGAWLVKGDEDRSTWLTRDVMEKKTGDSLQQINFSGIIPSGINTTHGKILTLYFIPQKTGSFSFKLSGVIYEDNASGVSQTLRPGELTMLIRESSSGDDVTVQTTKDTIPPKILRALIAQNEEMFEGKPFIIVDAKDEESGIATIEVFETKTRYIIDGLREDKSLPWRQIKSPALLLSPLTTSFIYLRVTDREGNAVVLEVGGREGLSTEKWANSAYKWLISVTIIGVAGLFLWLWYRRRKHHA